MLVYALILLQSTYITDSSTFVCFRAVSGRFMEMPIIFTTTNMGICSYDMRASAMKLCREFAITISRYHFRAWWEGVAVRDRGRGGWG